MSEKLEIEMDYETVQAINNLKEFLAALEQLKAETRQADQIVKSSEHSVDALGNTMQQTGDQAKAAAGKIDAIGTAAEKSSDTAKAKMKEVEAPVSSLGTSFTNLGTQVQAWLMGFAGLQGIVQGIRFMNEELEETIRLRDDLISGKSTFDRQIKDFVANLGLQNVAGGRSQATATLQRLSGLAPSTSLDVLMKIGGQFQAYGYDITRPSPEIDEMFRLTAGFAGTAGLTPDLAAQLPTIMKNEGVRSADDMVRLLARMKAMQRTTPIPKQEEYIEQLIRLYAPYAEQGLTLEQAGALLSGVSPGQTAAPKIGTMAEQVMRAAIGGTDAEAQAAMGMQAVAQGVIPRAAVSARLPELIGIERGKKEDQLSTAQQRIESAQEKLRILADSEKGDELSEQLSIKAAKGNKQKIELINERRRERLARRDLAVKEMQQTIADAQKTISDTEAAIQQKAASAAVAELYRALPAGQKLDVVTTALVGMTPAQRTEFMSQSMKVQQEEAGALSVLVGGGRSLAEETRRVAEGVGAPDIEGVFADIEGYEESEEGQMVAGETRLALDRARVVTSEEQLAKSFYDEIMKEKEGRADLLISKWTKLPDAARRGYGQPTNDMTRFEFYKRQVMRQMYRFLTDMSDQERAAHPEIQYLIETVARISYTFTGAALNSIRGLHERFIFSARAVVADRTRGRFPVRTESAPPDIMVPDTSSAFGTQWYPVMSARKNPAIPFDDEALDRAIGQSFQPLKITPRDAIYRFPLPGEEQPPFVEEPEDMPGPQSRADGPIPGSELAALDTSSLALAELIAEDQRRFMESQRKRSVPQRIVAARLRNERLEAVRAEMRRKLPYLSKVSESDRARGFMSTEQLEAADEISASGRQYYEPYSGEGSPGKILMGPEGREYEGPPEPSPGTITFDGETYEPPATPAPGTITVDGQPRQQVTNNYYNVSYGNAFIGPNGDLDLPGRLDGII